MPNLRPYQELSIQSLREGFKRGETRQILCASTGAGKSIIAVSIIKQSVAKSSKVMFVCDRRILVNQFSESHLDKFGIHHGVFMAKHGRFAPTLDVQVASIQTLEKMDSWPLKLDLIIVDEIHAVMRKSLIEYIKQNSDTKIIGLTATPFNPSLGKYFQSVTNVITMAELVEQKFLVPFRVFAASEIDTKGVKVSMGEWQKNDLESRALKIVGSVVDDYIKIYKQVWGKPKKTICFTSGIAHGSELAKRFAEKGLNFVQISYLDSDEFKQDVLKDLARPDTTIQGVISSDILIRGFDQTDIEHVIIAKPIRKSFSTHVQMIGRGTRIHEGKKFCVIQDNAGNWIRFQDDFDDLYNNGVKDLKSDADTKTRKEKSDKEKKESHCQKCTQIWVKHTQICPTCGYVPTRKVQSEAVAGEMEEITSRTKPEKFPIEYKKDFYGQLLSFCDRKQMKEGFAYYSYKEKFGVFPPFAKERKPEGEELHKFFAWRSIKKSFSEGI